jgi:hypothetical protein
VEEGEREGILEEKSRWRGDRGEGGRREGGVIV